jgi:hypothetical protein
MSTPTRDAKETNLISGGVVGDIRLARQATELVPDIVRNTPTLHFFSTTSVG